VICLTDSGSVVVVNLTTLPADGEIFGVFFRFAEN